MDEPLIDHQALAAARSALGASFGRILGYFREDGVTSVAAIETAMRTQNAAALVLPAHTLKGEARQFGAERLALLAEAIETIARDCVETHSAPGEAIEHVVRLGGVFDATLTALEQAVIAPVVARRPAGGFGRRVAAL